MYGIPDGTFIKNISNDVIKILCSDSSISIEVQYVALMKGSLYMKMFDPGGEPLNQVCTLFKNTWCKVGLKSSLDLSDISLSSLSSMFKINSVT